MQNKILQDHFEHPRNVGVLEFPHAIGIAENPVCGDLVKIMLSITDGKVQQVKFKTYGCPAAIACSSILTESILNKSIQEIISIRAEWIAEQLGGLPVVQYHCAHLVREALQKALQSLKTK
ncbi:MAG: iron-sulfur cluster assembly scaffold protein [Planctomycetota bacterium]